MLSLVGVPEPEEPAVAFTLVRFLLEDPFEEAGAEVEAPGVCAIKAERRSQPPYGASA